MYDIGHACANCENEGYRPSREVRFRFGVGVGFPVDAERGISAKLLQAHHHRGVEGRWYRIFASDEIENVYCFAVQNSFIFVQFLRIECRNAFSSESAKQQIYLWRTSTRSYPVAYLEPPTLLGPVDKPFAPNFWVCRNVAVLLCQLVKSLIGPGFEFNRQ